MKPLRVFAIAATLAALASAQVTTAIISGTIQDPSGAIVPGVAITVRSISTGTERRLVTDTEGRFLSVDLELGPYEVQAAKEGFQTEVRQAFQRRREASAGLVHPGLQRSTP